MADRESVITHLQIIHTWAEFARERDLQFFTAKHLEDIAKWAGDAIALLKEQDIVRCKDCKHYRYYGLSHETVSECTIDHCENPDGSWFCADGECEET